MFVVCLNFNCGRKRLTSRESISSIWEEGKGIFFLLAYFFSSSFLSSPLLLFPSLVSSQVKEANPILSV